MTVEGRKQHGTPLSFYLPPDVRLKLRALAQASGRSKSGVIVALVRGACYRGPDLVVPHEQGDAAP